MLHDSARLAISAATFAALFAASPSVAMALTARSTSSGLVSVAQVSELLDMAPTDRAARQILTAYLAGVGEAAGVVVNMGGATCRHAVSLDPAHVRLALGKNRAGGSHVDEIPATPLIVHEMLTRAGCARR